MRIWSAVALVWLLASTAHAAPTAAQLEKAKQAFAEGKRLHDAGKLREAIERFKASYELSKNPLLLYNIGLTMEELGSEDLAVVYYRQFLAEAPADAAQRADVTARITALTTKLAPPAIATPEPAATPAPAPELGHHPIDAAPPDRPLDITAPLPADPAWTVTLYVRGAGQTAFSATPMVKRQLELVGRIPAVRMAGTSIQYYLEAVDAGGATVAHVGSASVPNVVTLDVSAPNQFYPDIHDPPVARSADREDPLDRPSVAVPRGTGLWDPTSRAFSTTKWSATVVTGAGVALGVTMYLLARDHAKALASDATSCGTPPCQRFDDFDRDLERTGQRFQTISNVSFVIGGAGAALAAAFWIRQLTAGERAPAHTVSLVPTLGQGYTGAAAGFQF